LTAILFEIGKKSAISFYIEKQGLESTFGAAASIIIVLIWGYYPCSISRELEAFLAQSGRTP
jgi:membrane protein